MTIFIKEYYQIILSIFKSVSYDQIKDLIILDKEEMTPEKIEELDAWLATDQAVGTRMTEVLWS